MEWIGLAIAAFVVAEGVMWGLRYDRHRRQERDAARRRIENRTGRPWRPIA